MGTWFPRTSPKAARFINDPRRYLLAEGPRKTSKTITVCQKLATHLYSVPFATAAVVVKRKRAGKIGVWTDLTRLVIEGEFQANGRILPWVKRPSTSSDTKDQFFVAKNYWGGNAYCHLIPLYRVEEVEDIFKNTRFSFIYVCEADQFDSPAIFRAMADQLRVVEVPYEKHQLVLDCNPPEEGTDHWLYKLFYDEAEIAQRDPEYNSQFGAYKFLFDDNPWLSDRDKKDIINGYKHDPEKYKRYVLGEWVASTSGTLFEGAFNQNVHVVGKAIATLPEDDWEILLPPPGTCEVACGWDLGQTSHAFVMGCKRWRGGELVFDIIDEVVSIDLEVSLKEFTELAMEKVEWWNDYLKENGAKEVSWRHWSDTSSFNYDSAADSSQAMLVRKYSDGKINFRRVKKQRNSVASRAGMLKRMLANNNVYFSVICHKTINAMKFLKFTPRFITSRAKGSIRQHVHPYDALTYMISHELPETLLAAESGPEGGSSVSVPL